MDLANAYVFTLIYGASGTYFVMPRSDGNTATLPEIASRILRGRRFSGQRLVAGPARQGLLTSWGGA